MVRYLLANCVVEYANATSILHQLYSRVRGEELASESRHTISVLLVQIDQLESLALQVQGHCQLMKDMRERMNAISHPYQHGVEWFSDSADRRSVVRHAESRHER